MNELDKALAPKSDQLNADDLLGVEKVITITNVSVAETEQPVHISFEGDNGKPWKPCKSMGRVLRYVWGNDYRSWVGKSVKLFNDPTVKWAGVDVGGIRISEVSDITRAVTIPLTKAKNSRKPYTVKPLKGAAKQEMKQDEFDAVLETITSAEEKAELVALNIAQYKSKLSDEQTKQLREAYKKRLDEVKQNEEELPV